MALRAALALDGRQLGQLDGRQLAERSTAAIGLVVLVLALDGARPARRARRVGPGA